MSIESKENIFPEDDIFDLFNSRSSPGVISEDKLSIYLGACFKDICRDYLRRVFNRPIGFSGYWTDNVGVSTVAEEIDICIELSDILLLGECKWTDKPIDKCDADNFIRCAGYVDSPLSKELFLFSKSGFTDCVYDLAEQNKSFHPVSFEEMFHSDKTNYFESGENMLLKSISITTDPTGVERAVDATFNLICKQIVITKPYLDAALYIDNATPVIVPDESLQIFKTPFGLARLEDLSSGLKSIWLVLFRLEHPELKWIPGINSMGPNAKQFLFEYLMTLPLKAMPFPLYCTAADLPRQIAFKKWFTSEEKTMPTTLSDILGVPL